MAPESAVFSLPIAVVTIMDLGRLERELAAIDEFMVQANIRAAGTQPQLPKSSHNLEELAQLNKANLLLVGDRQQLETALTALRKSAPVVHISFVADPTPAVLSKIITWFRTEIHPYVFLQVGLQPNIAAGCTLRTSNKYFDLSLRKYFGEHKQQLFDQLVQKATTDVTK